MLLQRWTPLLFCLTLSIYSCSYNKGPKPEPKVNTDSIADSVKISFQKEIKPIIVNNCVECHSDVATSPDKPGYAFFLQGKDDYSVFREYATSVSTANSSYTKVIARLHGIEQPAMPYKRAALPDSTISKIEEWIEQGAVID